VGCTAKVAKLAKDAERRASHESTRIGTNEARGLRPAACRFRLVATHCSMGEFAATKLLGLAGHVRVGQQCCPMKSARVAVPLSCLPGLNPTP